MPRKKKTDDFPIWSIIDEAMDEQAEIIAQTRNTIKELEQQIIDLEEKIETFNRQINMYIRNVLNYPQYDNLKDLILIKEDFVALVYPLELFSNGKIESLPETTHKYQLSKSKATKILNLVREYNHLALEYEETVDNFEEAMEYHDELMEDALNILKETTLFHLCNSDIENETVELFDIEKHILIVVKEVNDTKWRFKYIRKEDEEAFNKSMIKTSKKKKVKTET